MNSDHITILVTTLPIHRSLLHPPTCMPPVCFRVVDDLQGLGAQPSSHLAPDATGDGPGLRSHICAIDGASPRAHRIILYIHCYHSYILFIYIYIVLNIFYVQHISPHSSLVHMRVIKGLIVLICYDVCSKSPGLEVLGRLSSTR